MLNVVVYIKLKDIKLRVSCKCREFATLCTMSSITYSFKTQ